MIDNQEIDPEIFELLENEFLTYNFLEDVDPRTFGGNRARNLPEFPASAQFPDEISNDLTPFPSFHARHRQLDTNPLLSTTSPTDFKFYCSINSVSGSENLSSKNVGIPRTFSHWLPCSSSLSYLTLTITILDESRSFILNPSYSESGVQYKLLPVYTNNKTPAVISPFPELWEFSDFRGSTKLEFAIFENFTLGSGPHILATRSLSFAELLNRQQEDIGSGNWLQQLMLNLSLENGKNAGRSRRRRSGSSSWLGSIQNKTRFSLVKGFSDQGNLRTDLPHENYDETSRIQVKLSFRMIFLQQCLKSSIRLKDPLVADDPVSQIVSEFHLLALKSPISVLVETMKSLAWRGVLARALANPTSLGYWPLEVAILGGNSVAVLELLQRTGHLCIPPLLPKASSPFHLCVKGNSLSCFGYIQRFLKKYGERTVNHRRQSGSRQSGESMTFENCLEWRDENQHTPLSLACSLPGRLPIIKELLLLGADIASVNGTTGLTPFIYLCANGDIEAVTTFLSLQEAPSQSNMERLNRNGESWKFSFENRICPKSLTHFACRPDYRDPGTGKSAIHFAAEKNHADVVLLLLSIGVSCGTLDSNGNSLYHFAVQCGSRDLIKKVIPIEKERHKLYRQLILPQGYDNMSYALKPLFARNNYGKLALDLALDLRDYALSLELVNGMIDIYGDISDSSAIPPRMLKWLNNLKRALDIIEAGICTAESLAVLIKLRVPEETVQAEEKFEEDDWRDAEKEEFDKLEYLFALTPLSFKTFQNVNT
jgi:ankyrin repeat protein